MVDLSRDFWIRETGTGQQVAQLHERYMMMMIMDIMGHLWNVTGQGKRTFGLSVKEFAHYHFVHQKSHIVRPSVGRILKPSEPCHRYEDKT